MLEKDIENLMLLTQDLQNHDQQACVQTSHFKKRRLDISQTPEHPEVCSGH